MSNWVEGARVAAGLVSGLVLAAMAFAASAQGAADYPGIGRAATSPEVAAWDIDVRPDFKGLPAGSGTVAQGMVVWEAKCASCHGVFGESNQTFAPLVGGTTADDVRNGRVARLTDASFPGRTTLMKVSTLSTLWDYIRRAMPWTEPKSLQPDEVYAVTAYLLNLGGIVPDNYTLSDRNMAQTQQLLPNRNGHTTQHGLWPGKGLGDGGTPDVKAVACMKDCGPAPTVVSSLPEHARNAHGNLAEQNRHVGPQRGVDTSKPADAQRSSAPQPLAAPRPVAATPGPTPAAVEGTTAMALAQKYTCTACHAVDRRLVGPGFLEIARKYGNRKDTEAYLSTKIRAGSNGTWGAIPMPPQSLSEAEARTIARWLAAGAHK